jgi:hypothetical protein
VDANDELTTEEEGRLIMELLRNRGGIDPGTVGPVLDLAALGLVNGAWRNTCVENWHADGRLSDGDMLRVSSHTTWRARRIVRRWRGEMGMSAATPLSALDTVSEDHVEWLASRLYQWLVNPVRELPVGRTLTHLAAEGLPGYEGSASTSLGGFAAQAEHRGARYGFVRTAAHGALACSHWWGHPHWPDLVTRFMRALDDPADMHWGENSELRANLPLEPAEVADRRRLRRILLSRPWELGKETAEWLVDAGIRYAG